MFREAEDAVLIVAGLCSAFAVGLSSLLIRRHLMHFSRPVVQVRERQQHFSACRNARGSSVLFLPDS